MAKATDGNRLVIAALKHCATQKQTSSAACGGRDLSLTGEGDSFRDRLEFQRVYADLLFGLSPGRSQELEVDEQPGARHSPRSVELRRHPRFALRTDIRVYSRSAGLVTGYTVDISESGISAMMRLELPIGELVELEFKLLSGPVAIRAMVRHRTAFRYGFQFVEPDPEGAIKATCSRLAVLQGSDEGAPSR